MTKKKLETDLKITKRWLEVLCFINTFGFCEILQIEKRFSLSKWASYKMMKKLTRGGLVEHTRIFHGKHGVYWLSKKGASYTDLPALDNLTVGNYEHQLTIIEIFLKLKDRYPDTNWISERYLINDKFNTGLGQRGHIADGMLLFPDGKQIAIEIELTLKGKRRLERIFTAYSAQFSIKEVWYFCAKPIVATITARAAKLEYIKIHALEEWLP